MDSEKPKLYIKPPLGMSCCIPDIISIEKESITIGQSPNNDIIIPDKTITREKHCIIQRESNRWFVIDEKPSLNGTFLQKNLSQPEDVRIKGKLPLYHEDIILLASSLLSNSENEDYYWKITFKDSSLLPDTLPLQAFKLVSFTYKLHQQRLSCFYGREGREVHLTPKQRCLINYMVDQNRNSNTSVLCTYEELKQAIWQNNATEHVNNDVIGIVHKINQAINQTLEQMLKQQNVDPQKIKTPPFLENKPGEGYILHINLK
ncbi:hypothetical protein NIES22_47710 [Calothrix brevissima NIES-22]|nr:hypothetical protein NIES22_47710 [Calothrix brevissima NIES-22]